MTTASDAFTGGTPGASITGANWSSYREAPGGFNQWVYATGGESVEPDTDASSLGVRYIGSTFSNDQYSKVTLASAGTGSGWSFYVGVTARCSGSTTTAHCYQFNWSPNQWDITRLVNNTGTVLGAVIGGPANLAIGDRMRIEVTDSGTVSTIEGFYNEVSVGSRTYDHAGGTLASGAPGFEAYNSGATFGKVESWEGGDLGSAQSQAPRSMHQFALRR